MTRITSTILVWMILMNGTVTIMAASGLSDDVGVELAPGVEEKMSDVINQMKKGFSPEISIVSSLINMFLAGLNVFQVIVEGLYALPTMIINLFGGGQLVSTMVLALFAPAYLLSTLELVYMATGRDMI